MPVDPQVTPLLEAMAGMAQIDWWSMDPAVMRQGFGTVGPEPEKIEVAKVVDRTIPGPAGEIPVRIYTPEGTGPFPLVAFFHGGLAGFAATLACIASGALVVLVNPTHALLHATLSATALVAALASGTARWRVAFQIT